MVERARTGERRGKKKVSTTEACETATGPVARRKAMRRRRVSARGAGSFFLSGGWRVSVSVVLNF